ncbi:MAG: hypothetical protein AB7P08_14470 [Burkholderiales bacterium]
MRTHQVEVDDQVFQAVQKHAEPLVDTFNTAVRRLLKIDGDASETRLVPKSPAPHDLCPRGTPEALAQVLEVAHLVMSGVNRTDATRDVARKRQISQQAVNDKYGRQLGLTASQFDRLLDEPEQKGLKKLLIERFPGHRELIARVFE